MLVRGLVSSALTMVYVFFLFTMIVYVYSCISVELITKPQYMLTAEERAENYLCSNFNLELTCLTSNFVSYLF